MKTQIRTSFGLALMLALGILAAVLALGMFSSLKPQSASAGNQSWTDVGAPGLLFSTIVGVVVASDGTIFAWGDGDGDDENDDYYYSTNGGTTFTLVDADVGCGASAACGWSGTNIVEIVPSPNFGSDSHVFLAAGTAVYRAADRGIAATAFEVLDTGEANALIRDLAVAPNYNGGAAAAGNISVARLAASPGQGVAQQSVCTNVACAAFTDLGSGANGATDGDGSLAVEYSPNYASDGTIMAVMVGASVCGNAVTAAALDALTCEGRSVSGGVFGNTGPGLSDISQESAAISFPGGYNAATADNYWVATTNKEGDADTGSVFRRSAGTWTDVGPNGAAADSMTGIASSGTFASAVLFVSASGIVGQESKIYRSNNGGVSWLPVISIGGAGGAATIAVSPTFTTDSTVYAGSTGASGGFYFSTSGGSNSLAWSSKGIIADNYTKILAIDADPADGNPLFAVMGGGPANTGAMFRTAAGTSGGATWTRPGQINGVAEVETLGVSLAYATDSVVYVGGGTQLAKSTNGGESFSTAFIVAIPTGAIVPGVRIGVANTNNVFVPATGGRIHRTTDGGANWATTQITASPAITGLVVSPDFANDNTVMVAVRTPSGAAEAYMSTDGGVTFVKTGNTYDASTVTGQNSLSFDSGYATNSTIYAATDTDVYRFVVGTDTSWLRLRAGSANDNAVPSVTAGDNISNLAVSNGVLYATSNTDTAIRRALAPTSAFDGTAGQWFDLGFQGLANASNTGEGDGLMDQGVSGGEVWSAHSSGLIAVPLSATSNRLWVIDRTGNDNIDTYTDLMLPVPEPASPADGTSRTTAPTVRWNPYTALSTSEFTMRLSTSADFSDVVNTVYTSTAANVFTVATGGTGLAFVSGRTYYWQVAAFDGAGTAAAGDGDSQSPWSLVQTYVASAGVPNLTYPTSAPGLRTEIPNLTPGITWVAVASATDYRVQVATDPSIVTAGGSYVSPTFTRTVGSATPALQLLAGDLVAGTVYYWQVQPIFAVDTTGLYTTASAQAGAIGLFMTPGAADIIIPPPAPADTPESVLADLITADPGVQVWAAPTGVFQFFDASLEAGHPANDLTALQAGDGAWIFNSTDASITVTILGRSLTMPPGWSLKGL